VIKITRITRIKICGLTRPCDIEAVNEAKPDFIGFVFAESRRKVTPAQAEKLRGMLAPGIQAAGVFVNAEINNILALVRGGVIDIIQLHGSEDGRYLERLKEKTDAPVIKALAVFPEASALPLDNIPCEYKSTAVHPESLALPREKNPCWYKSKAQPDYILLDSPGGGSGNVFDWDLIDRIKKNIPAGIFKDSESIFEPGEETLRNGVSDNGSLLLERQGINLLLAGGLHAGNVEAAIRRVRPFAVDVSSGVETGGYKDAEKIREFIRAVRRIKNPCIPASAALLPPYRAHFFE
jgi:phosphoribosylanthranilate isomerase